MIKDIALVTCLFDYPEHYFPTFWNNAIKYFYPKNIYIARFNNLIQSNSYYEKLSFYKINQMLIFINKFLTKYKYLLFLDATDTNFYSSPIDIISKFEKNKASIIFGAERCLWPSTEYNHLYDQKQIDLTNPYRYLNSGTYFGFTEAVLDHLRNIINRKITKYDDQGLWTIEYLLSNDICIDQNCDLFFSTLNSKEYIDKDSHKIVGFDPIIIHDNGPYNENTIKLVS